MKRIAIAATLGLLAAAAHGANGEFNDQCAYGMSLGMHVPTDCSINEKIGGKTYCFSSDGSKTKFMANVKANLKKAQDFAAKK